MADNEAGAPPARPPDVPALRADATTAAAKIAAAVEAANVPRANVPTSTAGLGTNGARPPGYPVPPPPPTHLSFLHNLFAPPTRPGPPAVGPPPKHGAPWLPPFPPFGFPPGAPPIPAMQRDPNGRVTVSVPTPPRPPPLALLPTMNPLAALTGLPRVSPTSSASPTSMSPPSAATASPNLAGPPPPFASPAMNPYGPFTHLPYPPYGAYAPLSLSAFSSWQNAVPGQPKLPPNSKALYQSNSGTPNTYGPVYPPGMGRPRAASVSTVEGSPKTEAGSNRTSVAGSPMKAGPIVDMPMRPSKFKESKKRPAPIADDGAETEEELSVETSSNASKSKKKLKSNAFLAAPSAAVAASASGGRVKKKKKMEAYGGLYFEPTEAQMIEFNQAVALARIQRRRRPTFEEYFGAAVPQEEIIPCVCDGRYDGMEDIVSWIACDGCEAWFHGECVQMPPALSDIVEKWFCPTCRVHEGRTHIWKNPCTNEACARRWHADTENASKYCSRDCGIQVATKLMEASNEKRKKAWRDDVIAKETKEKEAVFRERVGGLVGVPSTEWLEEDTDDGMWMGPLERDDLARLREIKYEKERARNEIRSWLRRKALLEDFTEKLKRHNDELYDNGDQIICGFHKAILRLFDVDTSRLTEDELSVLRAPADEGSSNSWVEQCCENAKRTCPKHNEWQTLRMEELETELEYAAKCVQRLLREESEIVAMLEKRMEVSDMFGTMGDVNYKTLADKLVQLGPPNVLDDDEIELAVRSIY